MRFFTLHITQHESECGRQKPCNTRKRKKAFQVMMESARKSASNDAPVEISETTNWEKLYNTILRCLLENAWMYFPKQHWISRKDFC